MPLACYQIANCADVPPGRAQLWRQQHAATAEPAVAVRVLPALAVDLVLNLGDPLERVTRSGSARMPPMHLVGPLTKPILVRTTGITDLRIIRLRPWVAGSLFRLSVDEITDQVLALTDVIGARRAELWSSELAGGWPPSLTAGIRNAATNGTTLAAMRQIDSAGGKLSIDRLSQRVGVCRRHLLRLFRSAFGFGPKTVASIVQCQAALCQLRGGNRPACVAAEVGYVDQAHMTRSLQRRAGITPSRIARLPATPLHRHFNAFAARSQMCKTVYL